MPRLTLFPLNECIIQIVFGLTDQFLLILLQLAKFIDLLLLLVLESFENTVVSHLKLPDLFIIAVMYFSIEFVELCMTLNLVFLS